MLLVLFRSKLCSFLRKQVARLLGARLLVLDAVARLPSRLKLHAMVDACECRSATISKVSLRLRVGGWWRSSKSSYDSSCAHKALLRLGNFPQNFFQESAPCANARSRFKF